MQIDSLDVRRPNDRHRIFRRRRSGSGHGITESLFDAIERDGKAVARFLHSHLP
jgi:hypothetical protein